MSDIQITYDKIEVDRDDLNAVLYIIGDEKVWIPRSLIIDDDLMGTVIIPQWFVEREGLESYEV